MDGLLQPGQRYSRTEISELVGGGIRESLPRLGGVVVCGCFNPSRKFNPDAPTKVTIGPSKTNRALRAARTLRLQGGDIPVFVWKASAAWEYFGRYRCVGYSHDPRLLRAEMAENPDRGPIGCVLYLEKA